jgi:hypothetical protein
MIAVRLRAIIVKELWAVLRDPRTRLTLLVPPIVQLLVFGFASTLEVKNISIGVLNRDSRAWSQEVIEQVGEQPKCHPGDLLGFRGRRATGDRPAEGHRRPAIRPEFLR